MGQMAAQVWALSLVLLLVFYGSVKAVGKKIRGSNNRMIFRPFVTHVYMQYEKVSSLINKWSDLIFFPFPEIRHLLLVSLEYVWYQSCLTIFQLSSLHNFQREWRGKWRIYLRCSCGEDHVTNGRQRHRRQQSNNKCLQEKDWDHVCKAKASKRKSGGFDVEAHWQMARPNLK